MHRILPFVLLAAACGSAGTPPQCTSAREFRKRISSSDVRRVVAELGTNLALAECVYDNVETGSREWLPIATSLRAASDAGVSEALDRSLARRLVRDPWGALSLLGHGFQVENVCGDPYIEDSK